MKKLYISDTAATVFKVLSTVAIVLTGPLATLLTIILLSMMGFGEVYGKILVCLA